MSTYFDYLIIAIFTIVTRIFLTSQYLYEWDSVQYALSIHKFDILWHQPHPPGYIFFVLLIRLANYIFDEPNKSIIILNILISTITTLLFYMISLLLFSERKIALLSSMLFAVNPIVWFYSVTATIYIFEAFLSLLIGLFLWKSHTSSTPKFLFISTFLIGISAGFRQPLLIMLFPLLLYETLRKQNRLKNIIVCLIILALSISCWLLPSIINTGGIENYLASLEGLTGDSYAKALTFFGGIIPYTLNNLINLLAWIILSTSIIGIIFLLFLAIYWIIHSSTPRGMVKFDLNFFLIWAVPALLFFIVYIEKPGYLLSVIPPLTLIIVASIVNITNSNRTRDIFLFMLISLCIFWFVTPFSENGVPQKIPLPKGIVVPPLSDYNWDVSFREIRQKDYILKYLKDNLFSDPELKPSETAVIFTGGFPTWRHIMYYFPEYITYWLVDETVSGMPQFNAEVYWSNEGKVNSYTGLPFWFPGDRPENISIKLDPYIKNIVWFLNKDTVVNCELSCSFNNGKSILLPNGQSIYITSTDFNIIRIGSFIISNQ